MARSNNDPLPLPEEQQSNLDHSKANLERIKKQLTASARFLLQGPLLKRSETLRNWNQRWFTLDPTTGKMEYRMQRGDLLAKGSIFFDANSTITVSPINFQGLKKYDGCCFYIGTPRKNEYFLCAQTEGAARAWVSTLRAAQLVLKAHKEAVILLSGNTSPKLGTVAAVVAAANATARESAKEIGAAMQMSVKAALTSCPPNGFMDELSIMKETLRVKDEELCELARELRARNCTIKDLSDRLCETAEAAQAAAEAAHTMDKERKAAKAEIARLQRDFEEKIRLAALKLQAVEGKLTAAERVRDEALQEAHTWRVELGKNRERAVMMEALLYRAEETARLAAANAETGERASLEKEAATITAKEQAWKEVECLHAESNSAILSRGAVHSLPLVTENVWHQQTGEVCAGKDLNMPPTSGFSISPINGEDGKATVLLSPVAESALRVDGNEDKSMEMVISNPAVPENGGEKCYDAAEVVRGRDE